MAPRIKKSVSVLLVWSFLLGAFDPPTYRAWAQNASSPNHSLAAWEPVLNLLPTIPSHLSSSCFIDINHLNFVVNNLRGLNFQNDSNLNRAEPVLHELKHSLDFTPETFMALHQKSPTEAQQALLLAIEEAIQTKQARAYSWMLPTSPPTDSVELENLRTVHSLYLTPENLGILERVHHQRLQARRSQTLTHARNMTQGLTATTETEINPAVQVGPPFSMQITKEFLGDTKGWGNEEFRKLQAEVDKTHKIIETLLATKKYFSGEFGNIKFFAGGQLAGLGEIKFGQRRTHRIIFRYLPATGQLVLIRYVSRESIQAEKQAHDALEKWGDDHYLFSRLSPKTDQQSFLAQLPERPRNNNLQPLRIGLFLPEKEPLLGEKPLNPFQKTIQTAQTHRLKTFAIASSLGALLSLPTVFSLGWTGIGAALSSGIGTGLIPYILTQLYLQRKIQKAKQILLSTPTGQKLWREYAESYWAKEQGGRPTIKFGDGEGLAAFYDNQGNILLDWKLLSFPSSMLAITIGHEWTHLLQDLEEARTRTKIIEMEWEAWGIMAQVFLELNPISAPKHLKSLLEAYLLNPSDFWDQVLLRYPTHGYLEETITDYSFRLSRAIEQTIEHPEKYSGNPAEYAREVTHLKNYRTRWKRFSKESEEWRDQHKEKKVAATF
ncbi:MAG: hypothetical protein HY399_02185 [Elusimicrobia bacterium]|nr:hypothetical protein [Elusimicrobiota bacterium]